jgi:hypothetical protein
MKVSLDHGKTWVDTDRVSIQYDEDEHSMTFVTEHGIFTGDAESDEEFDDVYGKE